MRYALAFATALACSTTAAAQSLATAIAGAQTFEVASVRRNTSGEQGGSVRTQPGGRLTITNNTLFNIVRNAYAVQGFQIVPGANTPDWFDRDRWDIVAKAPDNASPPQMIAMLQNLIVERFRARIRRETREVDVYALVPLRNDGRLGPQLRPAATDCVALAAAARATGAPPPPPGADGRPVCGIRTGRGSMMAGGSAMADIARNLSGATGRLIVDATGLTGRYDLELRWTADPLQAPAADSLDQPSLFTAVQEQLGLKLEAQRRPVDVLVIDAAERPTED